MSKHDQRPDKSALVCVNCKNGDCYKCVDVLRMVYTDQPICKCERKNHGGEPNEQQVTDPFTGSVFGPHAVINPDGTVVTDEEFKRKWKEQFRERD